MFDNMRWSAANDRSPIAGALLRSLAQSQELSIPALRALSPLSDKAQVEVDNAVVSVGLERLVFVQDLLAANLTYNLTDPLSITQIEWDQESKIGTAQRTMSPAARGENALVDRNHKRLPIYLTTDGFQLGIRLMKMSQRVGQPLDMSQVKQVTRRVNESIEDAAINGATTLDGQNLVIDGYSTPGLLTAPNANTANGSADWCGANTVGTTGPQVVNDVLAAIDALQGDKKYGPYNLYVGTKAGNLMQGDFKVNTTDTIGERVSRIVAGGRGINIRVADRMPNASTSGTKQYALVQMTDDVVQMVNGQPPTVIPWTSPDGFTLHWLVMAIMIPRVRDDYDGNSGVFIGTKT